MASRKTTQGGAPVAQQYGSGLGGEGVSSQIQADQAAAAARNKPRTFDEKANARLDQAVEETPFLGTVGKEYYDTMGGTAKAVGGIVSGDGKQFKEGAKQVGSGVLSALTGGALRSMNNPPPASYMGGSQEMLNAKRQQYEQGMLGGLDQNARGEGMAGYGAGIAGAGAGMGAGAYDAGMGLYDTGMGVGASGIGGQDAALGASMATANRQVGSIAEQQQRMANDTNARQMMAMAASARGGNQAAAMRNAGDAASQNALITNQQIGLMRLKEEQDQQARQIQAQQFAASQMGDRAALGYGTAGSGVGAANTATGQVINAGSTIGGIGTNVMSSGNEQAKAFLDAEVEQNKAQLEADKAHSSAKQASKGGVGGVVGKVIGSLF